VATAVVDAISKRKLIQPVPAKHVTPGWLLHRISPRIAQSQARKLTDMLIRAIEMRALRWRDTLGERRPE